MPAYEFKDLRQNDPSNKIYTNPHTINLVIDLDLLRRLVYVAARAAKSAAAYLRCIFVLYKST